MSFQSLIPPSSQRPKNYTSKLHDAFHDNLSLTTILLLGASFQALLALLPIPRIYTLTPAVLLLLYRLIDTILITYEIRPNPYLENAIPKKSSAQIPDRDGKFGSPGSEKIAVLLLGSKVNHPLGVFSHDFQKVGDYMQKMIAELEADATHDNGFLGQTNLRRQAENGANEHITVSYWRSLEDVHRFAHGPTHREVWRWWDRTLKEHKHIGIMHEVYEADRGMWESVYVNFQPTLLGNTTFLKREGKMVGGEVKEEWISPLLDASKGRLRTSNGRRDLGDSKEVKEMFLKNYE